MKKFLTTFALLFTCALSLQLFAQEAKTSTANIPANSYRLRHTDALEMSILQEPDMSRIVTRVSADGFISLPLIGKVHVAGQTLAQTEELITKMYKEDYYVDPIVTLNIVAYAKQSCFVVGFVNAPQECIFPLEEEDSMTITKVIARCNGFNPRANRTNVIVKRRVNGKDSTITLNVKKILSENVADFPIINGDVIEVQEAIF